MLYFQVFSGFSLSLPQFGHLPIFGHILFLIGLSIKIFAFLTVDVDFTTICLKYYDFVFFYVVLS